MEDGIIDMEDGSIDVEHDHKMLISIDIGDDSIDMYILSLCA
jgi:hypothetical protein